MKPIPWYYIFLVGFVAGALVFWKGCERTVKKGEVVSIIDTVTIREVIRDTVFIEKVIKVPKPVYITKYIEKEPDPVNFELDQLRTYKDSTDLAKDFRLYYTLTTRGTLQDLKFSALDTRQTIFRTKTITNTIDNTKPFRGLYFGLKIGGNKHSFSTIAPSLDYVTEKHIFEVNYNIVDGTYNLGVGRRLF